MKSSIAFIFLCLFSNHFANAQNFKFRVEPMGLLDSSIFTCKVQLKSRSCDNAIVNVAVVDSQLHTITAQRYFIPHSGEIQIHLPNPGLNRVFGAVIYAICNGAILNEAFFYNPRLGNTITPLHNSIAGEPSLYFESGRALKNYYSRGVIDLSGHLPASSRQLVLVRNQHRQVVAKGMPDANNILAIDLPLFEEDHYRIETLDGYLLKELSASDTSVASTKGFALHTAINDDELHVEIRKGIEEAQQQTRLTVRLKETILFETPATFRLDTNVVETTIPLQGLHNALLDLQLTDEKGNLQAERMVYVNGNNSFSGGDYLYFPFAIADSNHLNDYLIAASKCNMQPQRMPVFSVRFQAPTLKGKNVSYQIQLEDGNMEEIGEVTVDSAGFIIIPGLQFRGKASILFYGKEISSLAGISMLPDTMPAGILAHIKSAILTHQTNTNKGSFEQRTDSMLTGKSEVEVIGKRKTRAEELEEKYISSNVFKEQFAIGLDLENDPYTLNYDVYDYLLRKVPGLSVKSDPQNPAVRNFRYRQGIIEVYLDEIFIGQVADLPFKNLQDIGYIRFIKKPVSSSRNAAGGGMLRGGSAIAGVTGTLMLYTRKYSDQTSSKTQANRFELMGFANE